MIEKLKQLLTPDVDLSVKLATVAALLGRKAVEHDGRITSLEARQLQKGDKGDKGDSVDPEEVSVMIFNLFKNKEKLEDEDLRVLMERTWETW